MKQPGRPIEPVATRPGVLDRLAARLEQRVEKTWSDGHSAPAEPAHQPEAELAALEAIEEAVEPVGGDTETPSWGYGLGDGGRDPALGSVLERAALIRAVGRLGGRRHASASAPEPTAPDGTDGRDEFDIDLYPRAPGSIKR